MSFRVGETVRSGNVTARVKNYYPETELLVLMDIRGVLLTNSTVVGDDSGAIKTFSSFTINDDFDLNYIPTAWDDTSNFITLEDGEFVAIDEHFDGSISQDYQTKYMVTL